MIKLLTQFIDPFDKVINLFMQTANLLGCGVGNMNLVKVGGVNPLIIYLHYSRRHTYAGGILRNLGKHNGVCRYLGIAAYSKGTEHLGTAAYHNIIPKGGMAFALVLTRTAQSNTLIQGTVVSDDSRLTDYNSRAVVNEKALAYLRTGVNFYTGEKFAVLRYQSRRKLHSASVEKVGVAMGNKGVKTGVEKKHLRLAPCRGVPLHNRRNLSQCNGGIENIVQQYNRNYNIQKYHTDFLPLKPYKYTFYYIIFCDKKQLFFCFFN